jgi:hypothetical protein
MKDFILKNYIHIWHVTKFVPFSCGKYKFRYKTKSKRKTCLVGYREVAPLLLTLKEHLVALQCVHPMTQQSLNLMNERGKY